MEILLWNGIAPDSNAKFRAEVRRAKSHAEASTATVRIRAGNEFGFDAFVAGKNRFWIQIF